MPNLTVVATIIAKPEHADAVEKGLASLIPPTLKEEGCINYDLHRDNAEPHIFVFHENWTSEVVLEQHLESKHIKAFQAEAEGKIEEVVIRRMTRVSS